MELQSPASSSQCSCARPTPYLILTNISKRQNIKKLLQIAAAYGCPTIFVVGQRKFEFNLDDDVEEGRTTEIPATIQNGLRAGNMKIIRFDKLEKCIEHIKSMDNIMSTDATDKTTIPIIGVEIDNSSVNLEGEPFTSSVAFMMGNEGSGMTDKQMSVCDGFIRISQYGGGTASLNVSVAAGLVLHRFFHWSRGVM